MGDLQISVLIADSNPQALQATVNLLKAQTEIKSIHTAGSGYEAVIKIMKHSVDAVLTEVDLETPLAGIFLLKEIAASAAHIPVMILTGRMEPEIVYKAFACGAVNYVSKKISAPKLIQALTRACAGRAVLSPEVSGLVLKDFRRLKALEDNLGYLVKAMLSLTPTEMDILRLLCNGIQVREVSRLRFIEHSTAKTHISHILQKFGLENTSQVVALLQESNFLSILESS